MIRSPSRLLAPSLLAAAAGLASAQDPAPVLVEGDAVPGVGAVTRIDALAVNGSGVWVVEADTDDPDTNADSVVLRLGTLILREGQSLPQPLGASIDSFDSINVNASGVSTGNLFLDGTSGTGDDSGIFRFGQLLIQEGEASGAPELTPGTPYIGFFEVKIDDGDDLLVMASVDDPAIASTVDRALVLVEVDASTATVVGESVVAKEGDVLPGQTQPVEDFGTGPHDFAFSSAGHVMFTANMAGDSAVDFAVYLDGTLLAQEGSPSPITGRNWSSLASTVVDVNDLGDHVYTGILDGDSTNNTLIVKNGAKLVQEGDSLPAIGGFLFTSFGSGPVEISNRGDVLWFGDWDDPNLDVDTGLFLNDALLVQEGVTTVGGVVVDALKGIQDGYALSSDGRFVLFEADLADGRNGAFLIDLGGFAPMVPCFGTPGILAASGSPTLGDSVTLSMTNGQGAGVVPLVAIATSAIATWPPCGLPVAGIGELLIDPATILVLAQGAPWLGPPVDFTFPVPPSPTLVGASVFAQGLFADVAGVAPGPLFLPTSGVVVTFGP